MLRELSLAECDALLRRNRVGRIGMRDAEGAYVVPISYAYDGECIYGHAAGGRKVALMRRWPHVALQVDEIEDNAHWVSVMARGRWEELSNDDARTMARLLLLRAFDGEITSVTAGHGHRVTLAEAVLFRIHIEELTGRAEDA